MKNILITGANGFLGRTLLEELEYLDYNVIGVDLNNSNNKNIFKMDLNEYSYELEKLIDNCDVIYHLASPVGTKILDSNYKKSILDMFTINKNIFELAEKYNKKVIFTSSSEVFGECKNVKEDDDLKINQKGLRGSYATNKLLSEFLIKSYTFPYIIIRPFNIIGKGQNVDGGYIVPTFVLDALLHRPLKVYSKNSVRDYCDIRDFTNIMILMLDSKHNNQIFNVGNSKNRKKVIEVAKIIKEKLNSKSKIIYKDRNEDFSNESYEIKYRTLNNSKISNIYSFKYSFEDTISYISKDLIKYDLITES